jgi:hypothetical protein
MDRVELLETLMQADNESVSPPNDNVLMSAH